MFYGEYPDRGISEYIWALSGTAENRQYFETVDSPGFVGHEQEIESFFCKSYIDGGRKSFTITSSSL